MSEPKTVLVIDDDDLTRMAYADIAKSLGYNVLTATDGAEGLKIAQEHHPQLIMLDMLMPQMDGMTFLETFAPKQRPDTKVLVLTNSAAPERLQTALELGAAQCLIKTDVKPAQIAATVKALLG